MPPRNKKAKPNGFLVFTSEWKQRNAPVNWTFQKCITEAGKVWERMNAADRQPYHDRAKKKSQTTVAPGPNTQQRKEQTKRNCIGDLVADVERRCKEAEKQLIAMNRTIDNTIRTAVHEYNLESKQFYFIMVNYFTKSLDGLVYIPAELAIAEFSLEAGVSRVYHTHINPGVTAFGQLYQTQQHAESTHKLPLPPNALGEIDLHKINIDIINFLRCRDDNKTAELPPLYTTKDNMPIAKSALNLLKQFDDPDIRVFSIEYLFYALKDQTCKICGIESPKSQIITNAYFERDCFEYLAGFSCKYHEEIDCTKYCAKSCVTRWGYTFADYMCTDLAIPLEPGRHKPEESKPNFIIIDPDNKETGDTRIQNINSQLEGQPLNNNYNYQPSPTSYYDDNEAPHQSVSAFVKNEWRSNIDEAPFVEKNVTDYQYPYETRSSSSSPTSSRAPSPPPPPQNLDFGYCNTSEQRERLSPLFNQLLSATGDPSSSPSERKHRSPSLERLHSEPRQHYSPPRNMLQNSPNRRDYRSSPQRNFDLAISSPSRQRRSNSRQIRSHSRQRHSPSRQRHTPSREHRSRRAPDHRRSPPYRAIGRRTQSPLSRDRRRSPAHRNRSPPRRCASRERRRSPQHSRSPIRNYSPNRRLSWQRNRSSPDIENNRYRESPPTRRQHFNERFGDRKEDSPILNNQWPNEQRLSGENMQQMPAEREFRRSLSMEDKQYRRPSPPPSPSVYIRPQLAPFERECVQTQTFNFGQNINVPTQQPPFFAQEQTNWQPNMPPMQFNNNNGMIQNPNQFPPQNMAVQQFPPAQDLREFLQNRNPTIFMNNDCPATAPPAIPPLMAQQLSETDLRHRLQSRDMNFRGSEQLMPGNVGMPQHLLGSSGSGGDSGHIMNPYTQQLGGSGRGEVLAQLRRGFGPGISDDFNRNGFNY